MPAHRELDVETVIDWHGVVRTYAPRDPALLSGRELDLLADALFWLDRIDDSIAARSEAFRRHTQQDHSDRAAMSAWRLFYDHWLVGETVIGRGWLERGRSLIEDLQSAPAGWLAIADADVAMAEGYLDMACDRGAAAVALGERSGDGDLLGMALQAAGRAEIMRGDVRVGLGRLDRAMIMVIGNELDALFTGWVYCNVIATCHSIADLRRANEWSEAALKWCESLREGRLYPGLCRVYAAELAVLRGEWGEAEVAANQACEQLLAHDERYAGAAHYMVGELARLRGRFDDADRHYQLANRLGYRPQPGVALMHLAQGDAAAAVRALRNALDPGPSAPLPHIQLAAALVEAAVAADGVEAAGFGADEIARTTAMSESPVITAIAESALAWLAAWKGETAGALQGMRTALGLFQELKMPYEAARERMRIGVVSNRSGDGVTAQLEFGAALDEFRRLGATLDATDAEARVEQTRPRANSPLTDREMQVVRLVAEGLTNREVAEALFVSPHTVARHLGNIYTKLDVRSRAAATAWAYDRGFIGGSNR